MLAAVLLCAPLCGQTPPDPASAPTADSPSSGSPTATKSNPLPPGVVARWKDGSIDAARFEAFLGHSFRGKPLGLEALRHLLQLQIVEGEAARRGLVADEDIIADKIQRAYTEAEAAGVDLDAAIAQRGLDQESFHALMRDAVLHEELVRQDLHLPHDVVPTPEQERKWTDEKIQGLLVDARKAPVGYAIQSPPYVISEAELGAAIRQSLAPSRRKEYLQQLVLQDLMKAWARENDVILSDEVLEQEIAWRRHRVAEQPAFQGMTYEDLLQSQGSSVESVRHGAELRTAGYLRLMAKRRWNDTWFDELTSEQRRSLEEQYGEERKVSWLLLHAVEERTDPLDLTFDDARAELLKDRERMGGPRGFARVAAKLSEDEGSRRRNGLLGWIHRQEPGVDPAVCATAFEIQEGQVSAPIRVSHGVALVLVDEIRPAPPEPEFRERVRRGMHALLRAEVLAGAELEMAP